MNYKKLLAAAINLDIDYDRLAKELQVLEHHTLTHQYDINKWSTRQSLGSARALLLRTTTDTITAEWDGGSNKPIKTVKHNTWSWNESLDIPYTRQVINNLPYNTLGAVRLFFYRDVFVPFHVDHNNSGDTTYTLGLSIIPQPAEAQVQLQHNDSLYVIDGHAMLLNDSISHCVTKTTGCRITVRVFGDIDYSYFDDKLLSPITS